MPRRAHLVTDADCQSCGACCHNARENELEGVRHWVEVEPRDLLWHRPDLITKLVEHDALGVPHLKMTDDGRCTSLRGVIGKRVECTIYALRPSGCRRVEAGSERCLQYRAEQDVRVRGVAVRRTSR